MTREDRRRQLVDVADRAFAELGTAVTIDEIADRAGITKPVLYSHFPSKEALIEACFDNARDELFRLTTEATRTASSLDEALWRTLRTFFGYVADHSRAWPVLSREVHNRSDRDEIQAIRDSQSRITLGLLALAIPDLAPHRASVLSHAIDGASERVALGFRDDPDADLDQITDDLVEAAWIGVRSLHNGERWHRTWS